MDTPPARTAGRWHFWRSPPDQPAWARPLLLVVAALAALSYAWGINDATLETFYGAAVRSMSQSWHNFFFGAFDPWGTVTVDKLPGAFWVQALSVRVFGFHVWSVVLPQAVEGTLDRARALPRRAPRGRRRRRAGRGRRPGRHARHHPAQPGQHLGLVADPAARARGRRRHGRLPDGTPGAPAGWPASGSGWPSRPRCSRPGSSCPRSSSPTCWRRRHPPSPAASGTWRSPRWWRSACRCPGCSSSPSSRPTTGPTWTAAATTRSSARSSSTTAPTGSPAPRSTSPGAARCPPRCTSTTGAHPGTVAVPAGPGRFLNGVFGRDSDWMLVPAAVALAGILVARRREPRTDPLRAATVLWGAWLFFTWCFFASSHFLNSYYLAALAPPIAALCGLGLVVAWRLRSQRATRAVLLGTVVAGTAYVLYLLPASAGVRPWVVTTTLLLALAARGGRRVVPAPVADRPGPPVPALACRPPPSSSARPGRRGPPWRPGWAPSTPPTSRRRSDARPRRRRCTLAAVAAGLDRAAARVPPTVSVITSETSAGSSVAILDTGREFLPVGGFTGRVPSPTLAQFVGDVRAGRVDRRAGRGRAADPQPRHAVGHRALPPPALPRSGQPHRRADDALLPLLARRRRPAERR